MGEMSGRYNLPPEKIAASDRVTSTNPGNVETDVPYVFADGDKGGVPVFKVGKNEFYQNMRHGRRRLRFKSGTPAQKYMSKTKYNRPFYISHDGYIRKIK